MNIKEKEDLFIFLAKNNLDTYNYDKALEESSEFSEVLLKYKTKHPDRKPDAKKILEEYTDFCYRGFIALMTLFPEKSIQEIKLKIKKHTDKKLGQLQEYRDQNLYKKGL